MVRDPVVVGDDLYYLEYFESDRTDTRLRRLDLIAGANEVIQPVDGVGWNLRFIEMIAAGDHLVLLDEAGLWSVGTESATAVRLVEGSRPSFGSDDRVPVMFGGFLYFTQGRLPANEDNGLWRTDFTPAGTTREFAIQSSSVHDLVTTPEGVHFLHDYMLYSHDGANVRQLNVFAGSRQRAITDISVLGSQIIFEADPITTGHALWSTNGRSGNAKPIAGDFSHDAMLLGTAGRYVVFRASTPDAGSEIWVADPLRLSSARVTDLVMGSEDGITGAVQAVNSGGDQYLSHTDTSGSSFPPDGYAPSRVVHIDGETGRASIAHDGFAGRLEIADGKLFNTHRNQISLLNVAEADTRFIGEALDPVVRNGREFIFVEPSNQRRILSYRADLGHLTVDVRSGNSPDDPPVFGFKVYVDQNNDGVRGRNEPLEDLALTQLLVNIPTGGSTIRLVEAPHAYRTKSPASVTITLSNGEIGNVDFVQEPIVGALRVTVFDDFNRNGTQDAGEPGIDGARFFVDRDRDGFQSFGETGAKTGATGTSRLFADLPIAYRFALQLVVREDWYPTTPENVLVQLKDSKTTNVRFGVVRDRYTSVLRGRVFNDGNRNGSVDAGETGMSGVSVALYSDAGFFRSMRTKSDGSYRFGDLGAGNYSVRTTPAFADYYSVLPGRVNDARLAPAQTRVRDFAVYSYPRTATVVGNLFSDENGNGRRDGNERPIAQARVFIDENENGYYDGYEPSSLTSVTGRFNISGVRAGWYDLRAFDPAGFSFVDVPETILIVDGVSLVQSLAAWR